MSKMDAGERSLQSKIRYRPRRCFILLCKELLLGASLQAMGFLLFLTLPHSAYSAHPIFSLCSSAPPRLCVSALNRLQNSALKLEHADTPKKMEQGLMFRKTLPENQGMTFSYSTPRYVSFWMYQCYINLSIAFLDANHTIVEIHDMKAYPKMMDQDPQTAKLFFELHKISSNQPIQFAVEVNQGLFQKNNIQIGDQILWTSSSDEANIIKGAEITKISRERLTTVFEE